MVARGWARAAVRLRRSARAGACVPKSRAGRRQHRETAQCIWCSREDRSGASWKARPSRGPSPSHCSPRNTKTALRHGERCQCRRGPDRPHARRRGHAAAAPSAFWSCREAQGRADRPRMTMDARGSGVARIVARFRRDVGIARPRSNQRAGVPRPTVTGSVDRKSELIGCETLERRSPGRGSCREILVGDHRQSVRSQSSTSL